MELTPTRLDMTPLCWCCGEPLTYDDDVAHLIELEGGVVTVYEPNWRCVNPACDCCEG